MDFLTDFSGPSLIRRISVSLAVVQAIILLGFVLAAPLFSGNREFTHEFLQQYFMVQLEQEFLPPDENSGSSLILADRQWYEDSNPRLSYVVRYGGKTIYFGSESFDQILPEPAEGEQNICKTQRGTIYGPVETDVIAFSQRSCGEQSYFLAVTGVEQIPFQTVNLQVLVIYFKGVWFYWVVTAALVSLVTIMILALSFRRMKYAVRAANTLPPDKTIVRISEHRLPIEVAPFVHSINELIDRLRSYYLKQQRFSAAAAHDLRTPLTIMRGRLEEPQSSALQARLIRDVERMSTSIRQILNLARLNAGEGKFEQVDLAIVAERVLESLVPGAFLQKKSIEMIKPDNSVLVHADEGAVYSAMCNLVFNAVEHTQKNGTIVLRVMENGVVEIADDGSGISAEDRKAMFRPFSKPGENGRGHGMGLAIVNDIMELCDGTVSVDVSEFGGARFRLAFQLA